MVSPADASHTIVLAATRLFAAQGFDATSVQQIADAVGVTKQAVLHHFSSKEQVRAAVLAAILRHWRDTLPRLLLAATASKGRFDAVLGELHRFFAADPDRARVVLREALDRPKEVHELIRGHVAPWLQAVAGYIRSGQAGGVHLRSADAEAYVLHVMLFVLSAVAGKAVLAPVLGDGGPARYDRELFRIARDSLFTREDEPVPAKPRKAAKSTKPTR